MTETDIRQAIDDLGRGIGRLVGGLWTFPAEEDGRGLYDLCLELERRGRGEMGMYHEGYEQACDRAEIATEEELYAWLGDLFGRDNLPDDPTLEDLRHEMRMQLRREFRNDADPHWATVDLFTTIHQVGGFPKS